MMYYDGKAETTFWGEGSVKDWNTERAVNDGKAECCIEGVGDLNDGKA